MLKLEKWSFSFRRSGRSVSVTLQGFATPLDPLSEFIGELLLCHDESSLGHDVCCGHLRFPPDKLRSRREFAAQLRAFSTSKHLDPAVYEELVPHVRCLAIKLANPEVAEGYPNFSCGFHIDAHLEIESVDDADQVFDDLSDSMSSLGISVVADGADLGPCSICLKELSSVRPNELDKMPCSHVFHRKCIDRWLKDMNKTTCPMCRHQLVVQ